MNTVKCPGCQKSFNQGRAVKMHQRNCAGLHLVAKEQFKRHGDNLLKRETAKLAKLDEQTMDDVAEERWDVSLADDLDHSESKSAVQVFGELSTVRTRLTYRYEINNI
jgi:uncharacterized protein YfaT (DUF1175 family)